MLHTIKNSKYEIHRFDSQKDIVAFCDDLSVYAKLSEHRDDFAQWSGLEEELDWKGVTEKTEKFWQHGIDVFEAFRQRLMKIDFPELKNRKRKLKFENQGDEVDVERLNQGVENYFRNMVREETSGPTNVTVFIDCTAAHRIEADDILWRGAAGLAISQILESKGYSVEIWMINGQKPYADQPKLASIVACCLKRCQDPFDTSSLVNAVSGWFYRTATANLYSTLVKKAGKRLNFSLPMCSVLPEHLDELSLDGNRIVAENVFSFSGACQLIENNIRKLAEGKE